MDWVGKYMAFGLGYAFVMKHRQKVQAMEQEAEALLFSEKFRKFPVYGLMWLQDKQWEPAQIPCMFFRENGTLQLFCYTPGNSSLNDEKTLALAEFMQLYQKADVDILPAFELSRDNQRNEAICLLWDEKANATDIGPVALFVDRLKKIHKLDV